MISVEGPGLTVNLSFSAYFSLQLIWNDSLPPYPLDFGPVNASFIIILSINNQQLSLTIQMKLSC